MVRSLARHLRRSVRELGRFRRSQRGATAVEFALVAPAFLATLIAVLQTCVFVFAQQTLQNAAVQAGRQIMTGQVQNGNVSQSQFLSSICPMVRPLFNCNSLMVDVQAYTSFSGADISTSVLTVTVSQVKIAAADTATVSWSYSLGGTARSRGSSVTTPGTLGTCSSYPCYLIFGEMRYIYTPMFGFFTSAANITLSDNLFATPRSSKCVLYPTASVTTC